MSYPISADQRGTANQGLKQPRLSSSDGDEFSSNIVGSLYKDLSIYYNEDGFGKSVKTLIDLGTQIFIKFKETSIDKPLTKYKYAETYLTIFSTLTDLERRTLTRSKDGGLLESYKDFVADSDHPGQTKIVTKLRPWSTYKISTVKDIPEFNERNVEAVTRYILNTNPGVIQYYEPPALQKEKAEQRKRSPTSSGIKYFPTSGISGVVSSEEKRIDGVEVKYQPSSYLVTLLTDDKKYNYSEVRIEDLALGIQALSIKKIDIAAARKIARSYIAKYVDSNNKLVSDKLDRNYDAIRKSIIAVRSLWKGGGLNEEEGRSSGIQDPIIFFFSPYSVFNLHYDYYVEVGEDIIKELNGDLRKELNQKYQLYKIDKALEQYFQSLERKDFGHVVERVAYSRHLMVEYLGDDYREQEVKRGSRFFKLFEAALYSNEFPQDYKNFFTEIGPRVSEVYRLIKNDQLEEAIEKNRQIHEIYVTIRSKLVNYQADKQKWGGRAIFLMTLAMDLLMTYVTAGFSKAIPARSGLLVNLLVPGIKMGLYKEIGLIDKWDIKGLVIDAVANVSSMSLATKLGKRLSEAYNIPISRFKAIVIDNLLVNFAAVFQQELINLARKKISLDNFLEELLKNFTLNVLHEKVAKIAIDRVKASQLDSLIRKNDPSVIAPPDRSSNQKLVDKNSPVVRDKALSEKLLNGMPSKQQVAVNNTKLSRGVKDHHPGKAYTLKADAPATISKAPKFVAKRAADISSVLGVGIPGKLLSKLVNTATSWSGNEIDANLKAIAATVGSISQKLVKDSIKFIKKQHGITKNSDIVIDDKGDVFYAKTGEFLDNIADASKDVLWPRSHEARRLKINLINEFGKPGADVIIKAIQDRHTLRTAIGLTDPTLQAHHLIPVELLKTNAVAQAAVAAGFDFNGLGNGIGLTRDLHLKPHDFYNIVIGEKLTVWANKNPNYTPLMAKVFLESEFIPMCLGYFK